MESPLALTLNMLLLLMQISNKQFNSQAWFTERSEIWRCCIISTRAEFLDIYDWKPLEYSVSLNYWIVSYSKVLLIPMDQIFLVTEIFAKSILYPHVIITTTTKYLLSIQYRSFTTATVA